MKTLIFSLLGIMIAGLGMGTTSAMSEPLSVVHPLANTSWNLTSYNGTGASGTLSFDSTKMTTQFCNTISQGYTYADGVLTSQGLGISTMMYCEGLPMTLDNNFAISTGTSAIMSGKQLTITTASQNIFVFTQHEKLPMICTKEYMPVCGQPAMPVCAEGMMCAQVMPLPQTYGNMCTMKADGATFIATGACTDTPIVGGDSDAYGCKGSAGYTRNVAKGQCTRSREDEVKSSCKMLDTDLQMNSRDKSAVRVLQSQLRTLGYVNFQPTGNFGRLTQQALRKFQKDNGIETTGRLGPVTRRAMEQVCSRSS